MKSSHLALAMGAAIAVALAANPALAADSADWGSSVNEGVSSLTKVIVGVAGGIIGLCIVIYGIIGAVKQRIEFDKIWIYFLSGLLVTVGPLAIVWLIELMQKSS
ncbi:MAG: hypothetical protein H7Y60_08345 [Rhodospirillaceae bacterium]|nr:hypothetical protein [Rhodospirillales bacterium]